jgi:hypothetical protein
MVECNDNCSCSSSTNHLKGVLLTTVADQFLKAVSSVTGIVTGGAIGGMFAAQGVIVTG